MVRWKNWNKRNKGRDKKKKTKKETERDKENGHKDFIMRCF